MKPENAGNTQIGLKYKHKYTRKDKKYTNTKIQTHTNTNFAIGTLSQIRGGEILDFSSKSPLGKTAATLDPEIKKRLPMWQFEAISQEKKPLGKMESVRNCSRGVKEV